MWPHKGMSSETVQHSGEFQNRTGVIFITLVSGVLFILKSHHPSSTTYMNSDRSLQTFLLFPLRLNEKRLYF